MNGATVARCRQHQRIRKRQLPVCLSDGVTIYYATDGEGLGGYDIFVTRYNTNTDSYLTPENVGNAVQFTL